MKLLVYPFARRIEPAHFVALLTIILWSLTFVQTKVLLIYLSPVEILIDRFLIAWALFWLVAPRRIYTSLHEELLFVLLGASGIFGYYILENLSLELSRAINVGLIVTLAPMFTTLILMFASPKQIRNFPSIIGGFFLVVLGMFVMGYGRTGRLGFGDLLAMLGAMSFGLYSALLARVNPRFDVLIVTRKTIFWGVVLLMTYAAFSGEHFHWKSYVVPIVFCNLFFLALIASGLCFVMWRWAVNRIGAARASNYIYLVPVVNALAAVFILGEEFTLRIFISGLLILIGLAISQMKF